ncbi:metal-dependent hydrolase [Burkholderia multivorans]|uniref:metal-dependent hydrolase n=1 Tax=Burkholderia multivorans TaxID=87883 RepID=UPI001C21A1B0|nr:metal-dependent hydrolase [Burkholderia multivorans]MBU9211643.1 metal-dependent hydrolase [Burkholderia multivorans]
MMAFTHIAFGAASALLAAEWLDAPAPQAVLMLAGGVLGSMLPDIDHPGSAFGRRVLPISMVLADLFGHRGITHSLLAVVGMSALAWYSLHHLDWHPGYSVPFVVGIAVGYLSHLAGDWMTNYGVPLLWPMRRRFVAPVRIFTGDALEYVLAFAMYGLVIVQGLRTVGR